MWPNDSPGQSKPLILERLSCHHLDLHATHILQLQEIQEVGEDLGTLLGRVLESKMQVEGITARLEELQ